MGDDVHPAQIADAVVTVVQAIDAALTPVPGTRDVAALKSVPETLAPPH
jgi:hypothetical protein